MFRFGLKAAQELNKKMPTLFAGWFKPSDLHRALAIYLDPSLFRALFDDPLVPRRYVEDPNDDDAAIDVEYFLTIVIL